MRHTHHLTFLTFVFVCLAAMPVRGQDKLVVHEWGTFTSFVDETGASIGGINTDDEPVPSFVHNIARGLLLFNTDKPPIYYQGAPSCHPDVTMRLETPVLYFHAPKDFHGKVDVRVEFKAGWLTQFYPNAEATPQDLAEHEFGPINDATLGSLTWRNLEVNAEGSGPETNQSVWTAPRAVDALQVKTEKGETEKYLFYRGVGHRDSPMSVTRAADGTLHVAAKSFTWPQTSPLWYADIRKNGSAAFRALNIRQSSGELAAFPAAFDEKDYKQESVGLLRADMRKELVSSGLNGDEADALLNTWELSYFKSAGARLFFLVPQTWTDSIMPLSISGQSAEIVRVMVGRVELVSPEQRELLKKITAGPIGAEDANGDLKAVWQTYLELGRFKNALVLDEQKHRPTEALGKFIRKYGLEGH